MIFANNKAYQSRPSCHGGFTLIELIVTISIFVFMTALVLSRYNDYYSGTIFKNLAYDIAITIREAQSYGISVKVRADEGIFDKAYGAYFPGPTEPQKFALTSYNIQNGVANFTVAVSERDLILKHGAVFSQLLVSSNNDVYTAANELAIIFQRPNPEAIICAKVNGGAQDCTGYKFAKIVLQAVNGSTITVKVNTTGQISIEN